MKISYPWQEYGDLRVVEPLCSNTKSGLLGLKLRGHSATGGELGTSKIERTQTCNIWGTRIRLIY